MKLRQAAGALLAALLLPAASLAQPGSECAASDRLCLLHAMRQHEVRRLASWGAWRERPPQERVAAAPESLVQYLRLDNRFNGYPQVPRAAALAPDFLRDVQSAVRSIPAQVWSRFDERLLGVFFVEELGGTGFSDLVFDAQGQRAAGYIVLDASVLATRTANEWATWKERSPFRPAEGHTLDARIEEARDDDRAGAIRYILLHELGHVLSLGTDAHPPWDLRPEEVSPQARYPFFELSWQLDRERNRYVSKFDADWPQRGKVVYYFGAQLDAGDMLPAYERLQGTNFPTLYAATRPGDDFAESFASYVHAVLMKRPWSVTLRQPGQPPREFRLCWDEPRCAGKRAALERLLR